MKNNTLLTIIITAGVTWYLCGSPELINPFVPKPDGPVIPFVPFPEPRPLPRPQPVPVPKPLPRPTPVPQPIPTPPFTPHTPTSYQDALDQSRQSGMSVLLVMGRDDCPWCHRLIEQTLPDQRVQIALKQYIVYIANLDKEKGLGTKFHVEGVPDTVIIKSDERIIKELHGYKDVNGFLDWLSNRTY